MRAGGCVKSSSICRDRVVDAWVGRYCGFLYRGLSRQIYRGRQRSICRDSYRRERGRGRIGRRGIFSGGIRCEVDVDFVLSCT